jgi:hypothetical protein
LRANLHKDGHCGGASSKPQGCHGVLKVLGPSRNMAMNRNFLLILIVVLAVCAVGAGYLYYQERQSGIAIEINEDGVTIDGN